MNRLIDLAQEGKINENASVRDRQSIIINAPIEKVWDILVDVSKWPEWNGDIASTEQHQDGTFTWHLGGTKIRSTFASKTKPTLLSWTGKALMVKAIHVWSLEKTDEDQTIVSAEESIQGLMTIIIGHRRLHSNLINWLTQLKKKSEGD
ncbi:MAG: SRPBCC family protein [Cyclobacteriaceae bacterium]|nr:SRPBCC family protein [Cyclobacteriaceae bacterium HetDA_MAG_MS6]